MVTTTIDQIARKWLLDNGYPIHYYFECLTHLSTWLRELNIDTLQIINSANLPVGTYGEVNLPTDFQDDLSVCIPSGQRLTELPKQDWITPLRLVDSTGAYIPYSTINSTDSDDNQDVFFGFPFGGWNFFWNVDSWGGSTGGYYGAQGGTNSGYKLFKERRQIQMSEDFIDSNVVLLYISDGQSIDAASQITPMAFSCGNAFIAWKRSPNRDNDRSPEATTFFNQKRVLRSRLNELTISDVRNILHQSYKATIKN